MKEETRIAGPWELGEYQALNIKRTDIADFRDAILNGSNERSLWMQYPTQMARYPRMFQTLFTYGTTAAIPRVIPRGDRAPTVTVLVGPTGCGKTRYVYDTHSAEQLYRLPVTDGFWLDGYSQQEAVLFDEFTGNMPMSRFMQLIDRYPVSVPRKGGFLLWGPPRWIYITSNLDPRDWYPQFIYRTDGTVKQDRTRLIDAMLRRFTFVYRADGDVMKDVSDEY